MELPVVKYRIHCVHHYSLQGLNGRIFFSERVELGTTSWHYAVSVETGRSVAQTKYSSDAWGQSREIELFLFVQLGYPKKNQSNEVIKKFYVIKRTWGKGIRVAYIIRY